MSRCFSDAVIDRLSGILGDTNEGLSKSEIQKYLSEVGIVDVSQNLPYQIAKKKILYESFKYEQNVHMTSNRILRFIQILFEPARVLKNKDILRKEVNKTLSYEGIQLRSDGKFYKVDINTKESEIQLRVKNLKIKLQDRNAHFEIFKYCTEELIVDNYFHAVFEASKGLFNRLREMSGAQLDGIKLIEFIFSKDPVIIINNYQTQSERDEQRGFCDLLKGLCSMFRNPEAHEAKINWNMNEQDALDILGLVSYCHRRLDKAQRIRLI